MPIEVRPEDRILFLGIPGAAVILETAAELQQGLLVAMGDDEAVREGRKIARDLDNVLLVSGTAESIPWRDGFFTRVIDLRKTAPATAAAEAEIRRVLEPGGTFETNPLP